MATDDGVPASHLPMIDGAWNAGAPERDVGHPLRVPVDDTFARARAELAAGDVGRARQRLRGLVSTFPHRVDLRTELAATYRATGDPVQAGRWGFLDPGADPAEVHAFLTAHPDPVARMRAMRWSGPEDAAGPVAAARLADLRTAAEEATGGPVTWRADRPRYPAHVDTVGERLANAGCVGSLLLVLALAVLGLVTVIRWIW